MLNPSSPGAVEVEEVEASAGQGITNQNPLFEANKPKNSRKMNRSMRINKPPK
tara:strand:- start:610 stop:768 length:159 start_codon:yes stop_codon:yes gene_type:complete